MTNEQFTRVQALRDELTRARRAFSQSPSPALSSSIRRIARALRHHSVTLYHVECTDTFGGEANYCWVRRFAVRGAAVCFFVSWPVDSRPAAELAKDYPLVNPERVQ